VYIAGRSWGRPRAELGGPGPELQNWVAAGQLGCRWEKQAGHEEFLSDRNHDYFLWTITNVFFGPGYFKNETSRDKTP